MSDSSETDRLLDRYGQGDKSALGELLGHHRDYIRRLVELRMEDAIRGRVDPSDVVQETQLMVTHRIDEFLRQRPISFRVWLRRAALERLIDTRRKHLAKKRSVRREHRISDASSLSIVEQLLAGSPSGMLQRKELAQQVRDAIDRLGKNDREIILLRHVEGLTSVEVAEVLNIEPAAGRKRHGRAVMRLLKRLSAMGITQGS